MILKTLQTLPFVGLLDLSYDKYIPLPRDNYNTSISHAWDAILLSYKSLESCIEYLWLVAYIHLDPATKMVPTVSQVTDGAEKLFLKQQLEQPNETMKENVSGCMLSNRLDYGVDRVFIVPQKGMLYPSYFRYFDVNEKLPPTKIFGLFRQTHCLHSLFNLTLP